jgi:hypothetical protein
MNGDLVGGWDDLIFHANVAVLVVQQRGEAVSGCAHVAAKDVGHSGESARATK